jgi:multiple RNA-binding domain-containing protein 1
LYGRHLIIERAADDDDVDTIRKKTTAKFEANETASKRARLGA